MVRVRLAAIEADIPVPRWRIACERAPQQQLRRCVKVRMAGAAGQGVAPHGSLVVSFRQIEPTLPIGGTEAKQNRFRAGPVTQATI